MNRIVRLDKKDILLLILLWLGITFLLTLWPFNFFLKNDATSTSDGAFHFESPSVAYLQRLPENFHKLKKFSIILEAKSEITSLDFDGIIFSNCIDYNNQNILLVQVHENIELFINVNGIHRVIFAGDYFEKDNPVWIEISYDGNNLSFLKNGSVKKVETIGKIDFSRWNSSYPFVFANGGDGMNPWSGTIYSFDLFDSVVAISNRQQLETLKNQLLPIINLPVHHNQISKYKLKSEDSTNSIVIPKFFNPPGKSLLVSLDNFVEWGHVDYRDFFLNTLLFIPFGFLLRLLLEKQTNHYYLSLSITMIAGLLLTISIETSQIFLPDRYTSIMDVLSNTLGTIVGALLLALPWIRRTFNLRRPK